ncbi:MAG: metallophosphoesterase family protein [Ignavibacteria bacterium]|nr:metallophosphoesterase family protein [Ignavibacteria bacterium]
MLVIAFSDIHGSYNVVERVVAKESAFDVIVVAGDSQYFTLPTVNSTSLVNSKRAQKAPLANGNVDIQEYVLGKELIK